MYYEIKVKKKQYFETEKGEKVVYSKVWQYNLFFVI